MHPPRTWPTHPHRDLRVSSMGRGQWLGRGAWGCLGTCRRERMALVRTTRHHRAATRVDARARSERPGDYHRDSGRAPRGAGIARTADAVSAARRQWPKRE